MTIGAPIVTVLELMYQLLVPHSDAYVQEETCAKSNHYIMTNSTVGTLSSKKVARAKLPVKSGNVRVV